MFFLFLYFVLCPSSAFGMQLHDQNLDLIADAKQNNTGLVQKHLEKNADPNQTDRDGASALMWSVINRNLQMARLLLEHGANPNYVRRIHSVLMLAISTTQNLEIIKLLLDNNADPNKTTSGGWTPLMEAARVNNVEIFKLLLEHGANLDTKGMPSCYCLAFTALDIDDSPEFHQIAEEFNNERQEENKEQEYTSCWGWFL